MIRRSKRFEKFLMIASVFAATAFALPAAAQEATEDTTKVSSTGKGIAGGVLLGAELPIIGMAIGKVNSTWPYIVFGAVGAAGGGVGGYFLEQEVAEPEASLYLLAGGMALVIPTLVSALNATAYEPGGEEEGFESMDGVEPEEGQDGKPSVKGSGSVNVQARRPAIPFALVGLTEAGVSPGIPRVEVRRSFTDREVVQFGATQRTEVHMPLFGGTF